MLTSKRFVQTYAGLWLLISLLTGSTAFAGEMYGIVLQQQLLKDKAVRSQLNLNSEQTEFLDQLLTKLDEEKSRATTDITPLPREPATEDIHKWLDAAIAAMSPLSDRFEQQLTPQLKAGQVKRLRELCVQCRSDKHPFSFLSTNTQVQANLELSKDQVAQLKAQLVKLIHDRKNQNSRLAKEQLSEILTSEQRNKLKQLKGDPFLARRYMREQGKDLAPLRLPVRVHLMTSDTVSELQCSFTDDELRAQFAAVNVIWAQAGIVWEIESIVREPVAISEGYRELLASAATPDRRVTNRHEVLRRLLPEKNKLDPGFNVYLVDDLGAVIGGVYYSRQLAIFSGRFGPTGEQRPSVLAHELGHSLNLSHASDKDTTNLMSRGGANPTQMLATYLNTEQIETARKQARTRRPAGIIRQLDFLWKRNDKNGDDVITIDEANPVVKRYFNTFDDDADGVVDRIEFDQNAAQILRRRER